MDLLTIAEVADAHGLSIYAAREWVRRGLLTPVRRLGGGAGGTMLFSKSDVEAFVPPSRAKAVAP